MLLPITWLLGPGPRIPDDKQRQYNFDQAEHGIEIPTLRDGHDRDDDQGVYHAENDVQPATKSHRQHDGEKRHQARNYHHASHPQQHSLGTTSERSPSL